MMISATRRCGGDDDDLHEQGFTKPSKRRGTGGGGAAPSARGCGGYGGGGVAQPPWEMGAARVRVLGGAARAAWGFLLGVPHPPCLSIYRWRGRALVPAGQGVAWPPSRVPLGLLLGFGRPPS